ncbi:MAG: carbonic anhydrase [Bradyrhizobiaceae bacterium]|nr:carbonic anhydrase [Bradyrhizobiaceae bacterium]
MEDYRRLLLNNKAWVAEKLALREDYFSQSAAEQKPEYLWIGCSDSRVPAEDITGAQPGELFVHRNIANMVIHTDFNVLSVVQYAIEVLAVKHIIVCGHYGCGGIRTAMSKKDLGIINQWLRHIKDVYRIHADEIEGLPNQEKQMARLVELNVIEQAKRIADLSFTQRSWLSNNKPTVHGWVYDIYSGSLNDLIRIDPQSSVDGIYAYDFSA